MSTKPALLVTAADLAPQALALLTDYEIVFAGKTPSEDDIVALCKHHDPVAIIVRYSKVGAAAMDAAPSLKVISKHGSGTDTIDKVAAKERGIQVVAAVGANAAAVAEQALALLLACAKSVVALNERMHAGHWDKATHKSVELEGRTVGVWFPKSVVTLQNRAVYAPMAWILRKGREAAASRNAFEAYFFAANLRVA